MISSRYQTYLEHFKRTVPLCEFHADKDGKNLVGLRHDVDHDLDMALEMSYWEREAGIRSSYFLLPTATYWQEKGFVEKALQIQDFNHEIGLHVNIISQWMEGLIDDTLDGIREQIQTLRQSAMRLTGMSSHGDRLCYQNNFLNYWLFEELRPGDPEDHETGRNAEGIPALPREKAITYPGQHQLARKDGSRLSLWSVSMKALELQYDAVHLPCDTYFTDSGGDWKRSSNPLDHDLSSGRHQILIHPEYWRGRKRLYFFLSTARSGSRWLAEVLDKATPLKARHEYILNQEFQRGESARKATANFRALEDDPETVITKLSQAWEELEGLKGDCAEVNVYLASFVEELQRFFPEAVFIHLHRHPAQVVRSLMDRDWYDTPQDHAHPRLRKADAATLTRFERVCQYVAETNERLHEACNDEVGLQELTQSPTLLSGALRRIRIPYYPRLGNHLTSTVINATKIRKFPSKEQWTLNQKLIFVQRIGKICQILDYPTPISNRSLAVAVGESLNKVCRWCHHNVKRLRSNLLYRPLKKIEIDMSRIKGVNCEVSVENCSVIIRPQTYERHTYLTLGGSGWNALKNDNSGHSGWPVLKMNYVRGSLKICLPNRGSVVLFAISYGTDDKQLYRRQIGVVDALHPRLDFSFAPHPQSVVFDIAMYISKTQFLKEITLLNCCLENVSSKFYNNIESK